MTSILTYTLWPLIGYLFGSISSAILVSKLFNLTDPRQVGSGNPGATNVLRSGNKLAAFVTLLGDLLKGTLPILIAKQFIDQPAIIALVSIAAFLGHLYPVFFGFKGGKGVATAIGVFLALSPWLFAVFVGSWLLCAVTTRYSSLSALVASAVSLLASFAIFNQTDQMPYIGAIILIVALLFLRHRDNIERLRNGQEGKIGKKK